MRPRRTNKPGLSTALMIAAAFGAELPSATAMTDRRKRTWNLPHQGARECERRRLGGFHKRRAEKPS